MCTRVSVHFPVVFATIPWSKVFYFLPYLDTDLRLDERVTDRNNVQSIY